MTDTENEGWICETCGKYYKTKGNATKHAKETKHLNFKKGFIDKTENNA